MMLMKTNYLSYKKIKIKKDLEDLNEKILFLIKIKFIK